MGTACSCTNDGESGYEKENSTQEVISSKVDLMVNQTQECVETRSKTNTLHNDHTTVDSNHKLKINQPSPTVNENANDITENVRNNVLNGHVPKENSNDNIENVRNVEHSELNGHVPNRNLSVISPIGVEENVEISNSPETLLNSEDLSLDNLAPLIKQAKDLIFNAKASKDEDLVAKMTTELASLVLRLEHAVIRLEKTGGPGAAKQIAQSSTASSQEESSTPYIVAWDDMLNGPFKNFMAKSKSIGGDVETIAKLVEACFLTQRAFLICATKSNKPSEADFPKMCQPTGMRIQAVVDFRESNRSSRFFNHLSSISEAIPALSWVTIEPAPSPFIKEMGDAGTFYTNRILKEYKDKDKTHVEWTRDWIGIFKEMQAYVKQYHTTGVSWNPKGGRALDNLKDAPISSGVPPPPPPGCPPPPPPPPMMTAAPSANSSAVDDRAALFAQLNKGDAVTAGLKKVTSDMQTHKNPSLREGPKPFVKQAPAAPSSVPKQAAPEKEPRLEQEGRKWFVEYQKNNKNIIIDDTSMDQTVYIFRCEGSVVQVKGKLNNIILDSCKKTSLVFDSLVSSFEVVNCQSCEVQVLGTIRSCTIEKTDGCQIYLSKESLGLEVVTSKSTTMNLLVPNDDGEYSELPIPEQFKTQIKGGKLETHATEIAG